MLEYVILDYLKTPTQSHVEVSAFMEHGIQELADTGWGVKNIIHSCHDGFENFKILFERSVTRKDAVQSGPYGVTQRANKPEWGY